MQAMNDELTRSMDSLRMENMPPPYNLTYWVRDQADWVAEARYGALTTSSHSRGRYLSIELRVGSPALDNCNFADSWNDIYRSRRSLVDEDNYATLRHQIWLQTDDAYKSALDLLSKKSAYLQTHPTNDTIPDFTAGDKVEYSDKIEPIEVDLRSIETEITAASLALNDFEQLQDWKIRFSGGNTVTRYCNSQGSRTTKQNVTLWIEVSATILANDGERITGFLNYLVKSTKELPSSEKLTADVRDFATKLVASAGAVALKDYTGPVLFTDIASAQLVADLFAAQVIPARPPLCSEAYMSDYFKGGKLVGRLNQRVFPEFINVTDEPLRRELTGTPLLRGQTVDDDGVMSKNITLVKNGRLVALPLGSAPIAKQSGSNGHGRLFPNQMVIPTVTNLFVNSDETMSDANLLKKLRKLAKDSGLGYALLITHLSDPNISSNYAWSESSSEKEELLPVPLQMFKVDVKDGSLTPVRGLQFSEVTVRNLRDILTTGKKQHPYNLVMNAPIGGYPYPVTIVTPSLLVEEMEFKAISSHEQLPVTARPTKP